MCKFLVDSFIHHRNYVSVVLYDFGDKRYIARKSRLFHSHQPVEVSRLFQRRRRFPSRKTITNSFAVFLQPNQVPGLPGASSPTAHRSNGHSSYQIGPNLNKSEIPIIKIWTLYPQLHHCIRSTFSQYWIIRKLNTD